MTEPTQQELEAAYAWENVDHVPKHPEVTAFKRRARYAQSLWREQHDHPIGHHEHKGESRPLGSRIEAGYAERTGSNFLYPEALDAVRHRLAHPEPDQTLAPGRLWRDLLSSVNGQVEVPGGGHQKSPPLGVFSR